MDLWRGHLIIGPDVSSVDNLLGLLSRTMDKLDDAQTHFEDALACCCKAGFRPELAWTCCDYADTLLQRNQTGDREKAMSLLDESLAVSSELGMRTMPVVGRRRLTDMASDRVKRQIDRLLDEAVQAIAQGNRAILLQRMGADARALAMSLLDESLAISSELGMRPLMERVLSRREILGA